MFYTNVSVEFIRIGGAREGFVRARIDGEIVELESNTRVKLDPKQKHAIEAVVDRLVIDDKIRVVRVFRGQSSATPRSRWTRLAAFETLRR